MAQERPGIMVYFDDVLPSLQCLTVEDTGRLFIAMLQYGRDGTAPDFGDSAGLNIAWNFIRPKIDRDNASYNKAVLKSRYGVYKREAKKRREALLTFDEWCQTQQSASSIIVSPSPPIMGAYPTGISNCNQQPELEPEPAMGREDARTAPPASIPGKKSRSRFVPPTLEEVTEYVRSRNSPVDPQGFIDFYSAKGWLIGKTPMKDWKAACRNAESWERWKRPVRAGKSDAMDALRELHDVFSEGDQR